MIRSTAFHLLEASLLHHSRVFLFSTTEGSMFFDERVRLAMVTMLTFNHFTAYPQDAKSPCLDSPSWSRKELNVSLQNIIYC